MLCWRGVVQFVNMILQALMKQRYVNANDVFRVLFY